MDILWWISGGAIMPGMAQELFRPWVTLVLAAGVAVGYAVLAFNWYLQSGLATPDESRRALLRLAAIILCAALSGTLFILSDLGWPVWRTYDLTLAALAAYTWWSAAHTRALRRLNGRLAQVAELERAARQYREIAESLPHVVWTAAGDGSIDFANERWRQYAGTGRSWLDAVHPDEYAGVTEWWNRALADRVPVARDVRLLGAAGAYRTFHVEATPVVRGDAVQWFGACADVEEQKQFAVEKENEAKQKEFLFNALSHDLRAPLNNVVLNAQLLKSAAKDLAATNAEFNESADVVIENAIAAGDLVTQLLDFARIGAQTTGPLVPVPMGDVLGHVERRFQPVAAAKGISLRVDGDRSIEITTDRLKLERIVSNLVDNAIKFTTAGGVSVRLSRTTTGIVVRVCDTGVGIPDGDVPHLFDEFYQADNQDAPRAKGFGMGLAICRSLARQLQGDVTLASTGPQGTCFDLTIPDAARTTTAAENHPTETTTKRGLAHAAALAGS